MEVFVEVLIFWPNDPVHSEPHTDNSSVDDNE